ncbi:MAG: 16S rRNA (adenine(1518)-N(6)/adenine(1519)-N(6))-dimethyltransferase RsmA [Oscillospiraceae bacterium]|jgi:16S rRNA (adenine1518-N6/adenine1519-N6)-dimethyltransferase
MDLCNINVIKALLAKHGFRFSRSMGQNFLTASWVPERIAEEADLDAVTGVLEIGPGIGCLTEQLAQRAGKVVSVELDRALQPVLKETLADYDNVEIVFGDVLKQNIPQMVGEKLPGLRPVVCANLPYNITTPVLSAFLEADCFDGIYVMIQREVARRICAKAGTEDYGAFTVFAQWHAEPEILFDVSPGCFIPQPKVTSSVICLKPRKTPPAEVESEALFFRVVRAAFAQRRKTLSNALSSGFGSLSKVELTEIIESCGLDSRIRGEALDIPTFAQLANRMFPIL